jgi:hypothetical protein
MALEQWAPRALEPDESNPTKAIHLSVDGTIWETWKAPFPPVEDFIAIVRAVLAVIADESPKRRFGWLLTAFDAGDQIKMQCPGSLMGKNAQADALAGSGNGAAKAFADAMQGITAVMNTVLKASETMLVNAMRANDSLTEQIVDLRDYQRAKQDEELLAEKSNTGASEFLMAQLKEASPLALQALGLFLDSASKKTTAATAVQAGAAALKTALNGAPTQ